VKIGICIQCNCELEVHKDRQTGEWWCAPCKEHHNYTIQKGWVACTECRRVRRPATANPPLCHSCYIRFKPFSVCQRCGKEKRNVTKYAKYGLRVCATCRTALRKNDASTWGWCIYCTDDVGPRPIATRDHDGLSICYRHYRYHREIHNK